ncbi:MAG: 50S ribosomal protein L13 [Thermodesulfobacteriota bacterium]
MKTRRTKGSEIQRAWFLVDAQDKPLGRVASQVAKLLMGKHKPCYEPYLDVGDFVVVVNAQRVYVQERKRWQKVYYRHSGYPGGLKAISLSEMLARKPEEVLRIAVRGMLPKNSLGRQMLRKLKVYGGPTHPHDAQMPQPLAV